MPACSIKSCKSRSATHTLLTTGITFHLFPKGETQRARWVEATGRAGLWRPTKTSTICSRHFAPECFDITANNRRLLFAFAVPTLLLGRQASQYPETVELAAPPTAATVAPASPASAAPAAPAEWSGGLSKCTCPNAVIVGRRLRKLEYVVKTQKKKIKHLHYRARIEKNKNDALSEKLRIVQKHLELTDAEFSVLTKTTDDETQPRKNQTTDESMQEESSDSEESNEEPLSTEQKHDERNTLNEELEATEDPLNYIGMEVKSEEED